MLNGISIRSQAVRGRKTKRVAKERRREKEEESALLSSVRIAMATQASMWSLVIN